MFSLFSWSEFWTQRKQKFNLLFKLVYIVCDFAVILLAYVISYILRRTITIVESLDVAEITEFSFAFRDFIRIAPWLSLLWVLVFILTNHYREIERRRGMEEFYAVFQASSMGLLSIMILTFFLGEQLFSRLITLYAWLIATVFLFVERSFLHFVQRFFWQKGLGVRQVILCNMGSSGQQFLEGIRQIGWAGVKVIGVVDALPSRKIKKPLKNVGPILEHSLDQIQGFNHLGSLSDLQRVLGHYQPDAMVVGMGGVEATKLESIIQHSRKKNIPVYLLPDILSYTESITIAEVINGIPLLAPRRSPLRGLSLFGKRFFDVVFSVLAMVLLSPLFVLLAVLVKVSSPGPVLFSQVRIGQGGKPFTVYKFRGMYYQASQKTQTFWTTKGDQRRTRVGAALRKLNLDELPQLWNILRGEMSLVGPRPEQPQFVRDFRETIPRYEERHLIRPGLTGLAQVSGWRGNTSIVERLHYDLYYLENWSWYLDLKIILLTIITFFHSKQAY